MIEKWRKLLFLMMIAFLVGCKAQGDTPQLVASYPADSQIAAYPITPPDLVVVYNATLTLEVANLDRAVQDINNLAYENRGYIASSQSWFQDGEKYTTLVLAVPVAHFDSVHQALFRLGSLVNEHVSGELRPYEYDTVGWANFTYITVHLHPKESVFVNPVMPDWRPVKTFTDAWHVFVAIFGFLVDILIWVGVVAGPFLLIFWLAAKLVQRRKKTGSP